MSRCVVVNDESEPAKRGKVKLTSGGCEVMGGVSEWQGILEAEGVP